MSESAFTPSLEELPAVLPVFPLPGALVLPRQNLPLNIFEPRYVNMVSDALGEGRNFGMIQPLPGSEEQEIPPLCRIGCAGRITAFNETRDGRFVISLTGVCRFEVVEELESRRGYRRVTPGWTRFGSDLDPAPEIEFDLEHFEKIALDYFSARKLEVKWEAIRKLPPAVLVDFLSINLPLAGEDKQALLECDAGAACSRWRPPSRTVRAASVTEGLGSAPPSAASTKARTGPGRSRGASGKHGPATDGVIMSTELIGG